VRLRVEGNAARGARNPELVLIRYFISEKRNLVLGCFIACPHSRLAGGAAGGFAAGIGAKIWSRTNFSFFLLQAFDFPQNGQRNLWKYLEKTAADLEMFGVDWEKLGGREVRQGGERAFSSASPFPIAGPRGRFERRPHRKPARTILQAFPDRPARRPRRRAPAS
jgi:hypothetical protein